LDNRVFYGLKDKNSMEKKRKN